MAVHVTQIGKHRFVCGLFWQSLSRPRELLREAADLGRKIDSDLAVVRRDQSTAQAGFAHSRDGASRVQYSLAAAVSKTLALEGAWYDGVLQPVHNWLGAFRLPDDQWAYFAVRDANFLPNGDFAGSREEVLDRLHTDYALGGWNVVIGEPELADLGFHNFNARTIDSLLPHRKDGAVRVYGWWRLRPINQRRPAWVMAAAGAGLAATACGALFGWRAWHAEQERQQQERFLAVQKMIRERQAATAQPWLALPRPAATLGRCADQLVHLTPGGWHLDEYVCEPDRLRYAWSRQGSTVAMLRAMVPAAQVAPSGDRATLVQPLPRKAQPAGGETLQAPDRVLDTVMSSLQAVGVPFKVVPKKPAPPAPGQPATPPPWQAWTFALDAHGLEPHQIAALLDQPGVRVEKATYKGMAWLIEGVIYAK
ncbi:pilin accessory protein (PilO) [Pseudoduganella flava]|uniref:Pilin accessory protein (PilO) n=1 Tax=Pseudoduganella flava TaxID=871742 RepID=A0A562PDB4_9BURK|nr:type 4b pilus protein PilO2 [Pseudoduganella flava]QGZ42148.1 type 4b pilus protein PilO2 [Pseudoduganella flava]TWI42475.1 pilin accessory protein (PilO) [Pseudoduganella flava]